MIISIKNAAMVGKTNVSFPFSNLKLEVATVLEKEGYVKNVVRKGKKVKKVLSLDIVYEGKVAKFADVKRISKPSQRVYCGASEIKTMRGSGLIVMSTPKGILSGKEAKQQNVGGEVMFKVF